MGNAMGGEGEGEGEGGLKTIPRPFSSLEWSHEAEEQSKSPTGIRFKGAQRPKWRPPAVDGGSAEKGSTAKAGGGVNLADNVFSSTKKTKQVEKTVPLAMHEGLKREKDQLAMQLKALAEKYEGAKKRVATLEEDLFTSQDICKKYEGMYVIPMNEDIDALSKSIAEIDKDIKKYNTAVVSSDDTGKPQPMHVPDSTAGKAQILLETKVQRMEHLVYTLKKRINKYENCVTIAVTQRSSIPRNS